MAQPGRRGARHLLLAKAIPSAGDPDIFCVLYNAGGHIHLDAAGTDPGVLQVSVGGIVCLPTESDPEEFHALTLHHRAEPANIHHDRLYKLLRTILTQKLLPAHDLQKKLFLPDLQHSDHSFLPGLI